jgi:thiamine biosynthesis lipoprotein
MSARLPAVEPYRVRRAELWLGTLVDVAAEASSARVLESGVAAAFAAVARVHRTMSAHDTDSELSRVNRGAARAWQRVSCDLREVLACALDVAARSRGTFDPTVGREMAALGYIRAEGPPRGANCAPTEGSAAAEPQAWGSNIRAEGPPRGANCAPTGGSAAAKPQAWGSCYLPQTTTVGSSASWRDVELRDDRVRFVRPLALDLGGIAKGYAVDCAIAALRAEGVTSARVNAGGDLRVLGNKSEIVHVRTGGPQGALLPLCALADGALATSAYGGQRASAGGRFATSLIDPRVRLPVMSTRTVSVVAPTCMIADALTKVVLLRGARAAPIVAAYRASAAILSPAAGRWRCTYLPRASAGVAA